MMKKINCFILCLLVLSVNLSAFAQTAYISPNGTGSGYYKNSPAQLAQLNNLLSDSNIDKIQLLAGVYTQTNALYLSSGTHPVEVYASNRVVISSDYNFYSGSNSGIVILRSNISFENITFLNTRYCFRFKNIQLSNVTINNIKAFNTMSCIDFDSNITKPVSNININNLDALGYYKAGIRINGSLTSGVTVTNTMLDGSAASKDIERSCHIAGISISGGVKDTTIENIKISNNIGGVENCGNYQQGDGIIINSEVENVIISNAVISNSRDADLDLKGKNITLRNISSSAGKETRYNFKLWGNDFICENCYVNSASSYVIQAIDAGVKLIDSTLKLNEESQLCDLINRETTSSKVSFQSSNFSYYGNIRFTPPQLSECE